MGNSILASILSTVTQDYKQFDLTIAFKIAKDFLMA